MPAGNVSSPLFPDLSRLLCTAMHEAHEDVGLVGAGRFPSFGWVGVEGGGDGDCDTRAGAAHQRSTAFTFSTHFEQRRTKLNSSCAGKRQIHRADHSSHACTQRDTLGTRGWHWGQGHGPTPLHGLPVSGSRAVTGGEGGRGGRAVQAATSAAEMPTEMPTGPEWHTRGLALGGARGRAGRGDTGMTTGPRGWTETGGAAAGDRAATTRPPHGLRRVRHGWTHISNTQTCTHMHTGTGTHRDHEPASCHAHRHHAHTQSSTSHAVEPNLHNYSRTEAAINKHAPLPLAAHACY